MEELIDGGSPNITEPNLIKEMLDQPGALGYTAGMAIVCFVVTMFTLCFI